MKKFVMLLICIFIGILIYYKKNEIIIPNDSIRIRIIANSDNIEDLYEKKQIKNDLKSYLYAFLKDAKNSTEAKEIIHNNLNDIENYLKTKTDHYEINFGKNFFPRKEYKGVIYNSGEYDSLVITLGKGLGSNWWCVLYPPLCLIEDNPTSEDVDYRLLISQFLKIDK